ncbi:MAG: HAD family hydrolase [Candidatus Hydrogenedentota bacterium]
MGLIKAIIFDADDTLWESGKFFIKAENEFLNLCAAQGVDKGYAKTLLNKRDIERLTLTGYGVVPYNETLTIVFNELFPDADTRAKKRLKKIQDEHYNHPMELLDGVFETVEYLFNKRIRLFIYTKGEEIHQGLKIKKSGIIHYFERYFIVDEKNTENLKKIVESLNLDIETIAIVGDSISSDINPGLYLGLKAFYIPHNHTWSIEQTGFEKGGLIVLKNIMGLKEYV